MAITLRTARAMMVCAGPIALAFSVYPLPAQANPGGQAFQQMTGDMSRGRKVQFCAYLAQNAAEQASETPDAAKRMARASAAAQMTARLAPELAKANARLSANDLAAIESENDVIMGLLSYAPSDELAAQIKAEGAGDLIGLFLADVMGRCDAMIDKLGIAKAQEGPAPAAPVTFRWDGRTVDEAFVETAAAPFAKRLCRGLPVSAADFAGLPRGERDKTGLTLLDWTIQCRDRAGFTALIAAGGLSALSDTTLNLAAMRAKMGDLWFLGALLDNGVPPDSEGSVGSGGMVMSEPVGTGATAGSIMSGAGGSGESVLSNLYDPLEPDGGKAYQLMRAAGADINFPDYDGSMWSKWLFYARWDEILAHWGKFEGDPVKLGRSISVELARPGKPRGNAANLEQIKARLVADHGFCFPVGALKDLPKDERGFYMQPDCPTLKSSSTAP